MSLQHGKGFTTDGEVDLQSKYNSLLSERNELKKEVERLKAGVKIFEGHKEGYVANGFRHIMKDEELDLIESLLKK